MKYLIFDTEAEAMEYSHNEAIQKGLGKDTDICQYWYNWKETVDGKWAIQCPEGTETEPEWKTRESFDV